MVQLFDDGVCVYDPPELEAIRQRCKDQINTLWDAMLRFENPHRYYVDLSKGLWEVKQGLLAEYAQ